MTQTFNTSTHIGAYNEKLIKATYEKIACPPCMIFPTCCFPTPQSFYITDLADLAHLNRLRKRVTPVLGKEDGCLESSLITVNSFPIRPIDHLIEIKVRLCILLCTNGLLD